MEETSFSEQQQEIARNSEQILRAMVKAYKSLKTLHERFVRETEDSCMDFAGPELQTAMQLSLHKRTRFTLAFEDLVHEDFRQGGLHRITPKQPQPVESVEEEEQAPSEEEPDSQQNEAPQETEEAEGDSEPTTEEPKEDLGDGSN